ncbi:MAG: hypothetical protein EAY66_03900 [Sphingobacteriales bacterium]|nr:MAG: hypothetical protein EAY66_03900 [Sphingobacteriales bacterium]
MKYLKIYLAILFSIAHTGNSYAQNYFYTHLKVPLLEYIGVLSNQNNINPNNTTAGIIFNVGYAVNFAENFYTEIGVDYVVRSTVTNKFYEKPDLKNQIAEFKAQNSSIALQVKPLYKISIDADDNTFLTFGAGINYQKLYGKGMFTNLVNTQNQLEEIKTSQSKFHVVIQPEITIIFKTEKKFGYRLGLTYSYINWDKATTNFSNNTNFTIPSNKSSTLFFSGGFIF